MQALARLRPAQGIAAMQALNRTVLNPWFPGVFIGTAIGGLVLVGLILWQGVSPRAGFLVAGALLYGIGTFLVTAVFNVPMNDALEREEPASREGAELWDTYLVRWTFRNHVRTVAALAGAASLMRALG